MKVLVENGGSFDLNAKNFKKQGREGKVYIVGDQVFKIYLNPSQVISPKKMSELTILNRSNIVRPVHLVRDTSGDLVGFTMNLITSNIPLVKVFTTTFQQANNIKPDKIVNLVDIMKETYQFIHEKKCLVVDGNELNYLVSGKFDNVYFLDVDSFQTPSFPPTAYHPLTRDYTNKDFTVLTDWYTFAVISFQMFLGIHPYRGKYPQLPDLEQRVINHISIFNKNVSVPQTVRDFSYIPSDYLRWYEQIFEQGKRIPPPSVAGLLNVMPVAIRVVQTTDSFIITHLGEYSSRIDWFTYFNGNNVSRTDDFKISVGKIDTKTDTKNAVVLFTPNKLIPIVAEVTGGKLNLYKTGTTRENIKSIESNVDQIFVNQNVLYAIGKKDIVEVVIDDSFEKPIAYVNQSAMWDIMPESSVVHKGMIMSDVLGKPYAAIPFKLDNKSMCSILHLPELDGYSIVDARREKNVVIVQARKNKQYDNLIFKFDKMFKTYSNQVIDDVDPSELNFVVLDTGIVVMINSDDSMMLFHSAPESSDIKKIVDPHINNNMRLVSLGTRTGFHYQNKLYSIEMKKP